MSEVELISGSPKDGRDHRNGHSMRARLTIQLSALLGDQAAGRCTVNTTSRPAGPIYLITAIDQAVQARTSSSQNFEGMLKPAVRRPGRDGPPRPRKERRSEKNVGRRRRSPMRARVCAPDALVCRSSSWARN